MSSIKLLFAAIGLAAAMPTGESPSTYGKPKMNGLYFLDNNPSGSSIIAMNLPSNGSPSNPVRISTKGVGAYGINGTSHTAEPADTLASEKSVLVSGEYLFTVNAGSNTAVMFKINPQDPTALTMMGSPAPLMHQFPISVAYSPKLMTACVLSGGAKAGVDCFKVDSTMGLTDGWTLGFAPDFNQTTPPMGPANTASQITFKPDSSALIALTKGNPGTMTPGNIILYPVTDGKIATTPQITQFDNVLLEFGSTWLPNNRLMITDPSFGAAIVSIPSTNVVTQVYHIALPTGAAYCWANYYGATGTAYAIAPGSNMVPTIDAATGTVTGALNITLPELQSNPGFFDSIITMGKLYSLTGTTGIAVTDLTMPSEMSFVNLSQFGSRQGWEGMAAYPAN